MPRDTSGQLGKSQPACSDLYAQDSWLLLSFVEPKNKSGGEHEQRLNGREKTGRERLFSLTALRMLSNTVLQLEYPQEKLI